MEKGHLYMNGLINRVCNYFSLKGALCRFCILFESPITRGSTKGAFIKNNFCNYKKFHEQAKAYLNNKWHKFTKH